MQISELTDQIKILSSKAGFHKIGVAPAGEAKHGLFLTEWLEQGRHGKMRWMENYQEQRLNLKAFYPNARSVLMLAQNYFTPQPRSGQPHSAKISRYAWGKDYHRIMRKNLKQLLKMIRELDSAIGGRLFVDTAPIMEKQWAHTAGIGWQGKNTNILTREYGSWIFLGGIVINRELIYDQPAIDRCGSCTACIDACPTAALSPYQLDARRCISYLTIELRDAAIPEEFAPHLQNWIFGCDICQDVCPWNRFARDTDEADYFPLEKNIDPPFKELAEMTEEQFQAQFQKSPVRRAKYAGFMRNVKANLQNLSHQVSD
jgi:epoxyqueuosine reductase